MPCGAFKTGWILVKIDLRDLRFVFISGLIPSVSRVSLGIFGLPCFYTNLLDL